MTGVLEHAEGSPDVQDERFGWGTLLVVLAGTFMTFLDFFIVNVALPSMQSDLHAGAAAVQLVVAGYGIAFAVGMISGGRLGDLYGRRRIFAVGLALFTLTSAACGLAPSAGLLVTGRVLQGAAGALMTPQVLAILGTIHTGERRARAFASYGLAMGFAAVLGQLIGGALIQVDIVGSGWRSVFLINVPVGVVALALFAARGARVARRARAARPHRHRARDGGARCGGAAACRGARARLALVDLGVPSGRAGAAGWLCRAPADAGGARSGAAGGSGDLRQPDVQRRLLDRIHLRARTACVLLRAGAVPAGGTRILAAVLR